MADDIDSELTRTAEAPVPPPRESFVVELERRLRSLPRPTRTASERDGLPSSGRRFDAAAVVPVAIGLVLLVALLVVLVLA